MDKKLKRREIISHILAICIGILIFLSLLFAVFFGLLYDEKRYEQHFTDEGINLKFSDSGYPMNATRSLLSYYNGKSSDFDKTGFNEREISHLYDVAKVVKGAKTVYNWTNILLIVFVLLMLFNEGFFRKFPWKIQPMRLNTIIFRVFLTAFVACVVVGMLSFVGYMNFDRFFSYFHSLFFSSGTWLFYPTDTLIVLFPETFFMNFFRDIVIRLFSTVTILFLFAWWTHRKAKKVMGL